MKVFKIIFRVVLCIVAACVIFLLYFVHMNASGSRLICTHQGESDLKAYSLTLAQLILDNSLKAKVCDELIEEEHFKLASHKNNTCIFIKSKHSSSVYFLYLIVVEFDSYDKVNDFYCFSVNLSDEKLMLYLGDINSFISIPVSKQQVPCPWKKKLTPEMLSCFTEVVLDHIKNNPSQKTGSAKTILCENFTVTDGTGEQGIKGKGNDH